MVLYVWRVKMIPMSKLVKILGVRKQALFDKKQRNQRYFLHRLGMMTYIMTGSCLSGKLN